MSNSTISQVSLAACAVAGLTVISLSLLSSDAAARRILNPKSLYARRHKEAAFRWKSALEKARLKLMIAFMGGMYTYSEEDELLMTELVMDPIQVEALAKQWVLGQTKVEIGYIKRHQKSKEYLVTLLQHNPQTIYHVKVKDLAQALSKALPLTTTTFCFVTDASAGRSHDIIPHIYKAARETKVHVVDKPLWMAHLAAIVKDGLLSHETLESIFFALVRLQGITVPSQSTIVILLPHSNLMKLAFQTFPDHRHVFCYSGCIQAVQHASRAVVPNVMARGHVPAIWTDALVFEDNVSQTMPLQPSTSANLMPKFRPGLAELPLAQACTTEVWMAAADAYLSLKEQNKAFLPYVCKLEYILSGDIGQQSDRFWSVRSFWQYTTGTRTTEVSSETMDAVISVLLEYPLYSQQIKNRKGIENCAFQHKLILLENKTFTDTVQPRQHWTLKAATKRGCACCLPEEDDDETENAPVGKNTMDLNIPGAFVSMGSGNTQSTTKGVGEGMNGSYVDGKTGFAFDPSRFG